MGHSKVGVDLRGVKRMNMIKIYCKKFSNNY